MKLVQTQKIVEAKQRNANVSPATLERNVKSAVEIIGCRPMVSLIPLTLIKEIEIIHRLFLVIAMYCQASSTQFNESLNLPCC